MLFLTRLKVLLKRKSTLFWVLLFPILLASAEYFAFGKFIKSTPIETISIGIIENETPELLENVLKEAKIEDDKNLYEVIVYSDTLTASQALEDKKIELYLYENNEKIEVVANSNSTALTITHSLIEEVKIIEKTISDAYKSYYEDLASGKNPTEVNPEEILTNITKDADYFKDISNSKNATFYTFYFYSLIAMACLYAALFGVSIINDIRADRSSLGIRISSSVASKHKLIITYFLASALLQMISSIILYVYLAFVLKVALGENVGLILITLILGGIAGISIGMLVGALVKGSESKCQGIITCISLGCSCLAGLMSVDVKHLVDKYMGFINYINPAALITNSLYALYYYDTYTKYIIYTCVLLGISLLAILGVILKTRGEKYASL
ncbi:MAG: ABC transporter permease [Anaeroplasmataceae bacterium]|nr:ABC transporter permease [Anaeroplasmataceae bacterium]